MRFIASIIMVIVLISNILSYSQEFNTYLIISPEGHRSTIFDTDLDNNGNLITGSLDKTVKSWNLKTGDELKAFRGEIGPGSEGMIHCLDLSPDNKYLAIAGWFGADDESETLGDVRIYDYETGQIIQLLQWHQNSIFDLTFTQDSKSLLTTDASGNIIQWDVSTFTPKFQYISKNEDVLSISACNEYFITGHSDGMAYVWEYGKSKPKKKINFFSKKKLNMLVSSVVSVSPDGKYFSVTGKELGMVLIFNDQFKLEDYFFSGDNQVIETVFSPSSQRLLCSIKDPGQNMAFVYEKQNDKWNKIATFKKTDDLITSLGFVDDEICYTCGGTQNDICTWKINNPDNLLMLKQSNGTPFYSANISGSKLAFSRTPNKAFGFADYNELFDIFNRNFIRTDPDYSPFQYPSHSFNGYQLEDREIVRRSGWDPNEQLYIIKNNTRLDSIPRYTNEGNRHTAYSFANENFIITGGDYGMLEAYSYDALFRGRFVGHDDGIKGISISDNGKFIVTASTDMTMRLWSVNHVGRERETIKLPSLWDYCIEMMVDDVYHNIFQSLRIVNLSKKSDVISWKKSIKVLEENGYPCQFMKMRLARESYHQIYPVVSIFIAKDGEWVIWNNDGYFTSSKRGAKYVGYHVNKGKENAAKFYPFEQFDLQYNRPDIILRDLEMADAGLIEIYERAYLKRLKRMGISEENLSQDIHAPFLEIVSYKKEGNEAIFEINANDDKFKLNRFNVYLNDVPLYGRKGIDISELSASTANKTFHVPLIPGRNKIQFSVLNDKGVESLRETAFIENNVQSESQLFVAAVGVSEFKDENFNLNYAAKDAQDVINLLSKNPAYTETNTLLLTNNEVDQGILEKISKFFASAKTGDVVILYIAGHGVLSSAYEYYYATHNMDFNQPEKYGISYADLENLFDGIASIKKLLIMDTCHSGDVNKDDLETITAVESQTEEDIVFRSTQSTATLRERKGLKVTNEIMKEMFNDINKGTGTTVISSAGGVEFAFESERWKNGLFTYCLLNGLSTMKADYNGDGNIYLSELQTFISKEVNELSKGLQTPTARMENISLDYLLWSN